jgi:hypothetical protein
MSNNKAMVTSDISKENTEVILKSILTDNESLLKEIREQFPKLSTKQQNIALLLKLEYTLNEISIILDISDVEINETVDLIKRTES